jgi:hypothetical protein
VTLVDDHKRIIITGPAKQPTTHLQTHKPAVGIDDVGCKISKKKASICKRWDTPHIKWCLTAALTTLSQTDPSRTMLTEKKHYYI